VRHGSGRARWGVSSRFSTRDGQRTSGFVRGACPPSKGLGQVLSQNGYGEEDEGDNHLCVATVTIIYTEITHPPRPKASSHDDLCSH